jgi:hypothetical protein
MRLKAPLLASLLGGLFACGEPSEVAPPLPEGPIEWSVSATADKSEIQVGEDLAVQVAIQHPPDEEFIVATGEELQPFELIERIDEPASSPIETVITLRMGAYRLPGEISVPPIKVEYRDASGEMAAVETEPIPINLVTSLTPDVTDIHDIKGPFDELPVPTNWNPLWWLLAAFAAALVAYYLYRRFRKEDVAPAESKPRAPSVPPDVEAERALRELADKRLLEQGRDLEFYTVLAEIMKRYAGRRFEVPYLERTTLEVMTDLKQTRLDYEKSLRIRGILNVADIVKFARVKIPGEDSERMIPEGFRFVDETRPRVKVETEAEESESMEVGA